MTGVQAHPVNCLSCLHASGKQTASNAVLLPAAVKAPIPFKTPPAPPPALAIIANFDPRATPPAASPLQHNMMYSIMSLWQHICCHTCLFCNLPEDNAKVERLLRHVYSKQPTATYAMFVQDQANLMCVRSSTRMDLGTDTGGSLRRLVQLYTPARTVNYE